jgi:energy-coupling factor transporter ATP-binding protein EcfA2
MTEVHDALTALPCRHFLGIFDCCFAGAFRWSATRDVVVPPKVIHKERYERFLRDPAWQVITSAADDQKAMDSLSLAGHRQQVGQHSPFAQALIQALQADSAADASPPARNGKPAGDGIITATELYQYLRDAVEPETMTRAKRQTPGLWPLKNHGKGEFIFRVPGHPLDLPDAPPLNEAANPYRGLESFDEQHQALFFGRQQLIQELQDFVETHPRTVVLGASGSGKSSLVKAGLVPALKHTLNAENQPLWQVLGVLRPGATPLKALRQMLQASQLDFPRSIPTEDDLAQSLVASLEQWRQAHLHSKLLLVIDQAEELFSLCREADQRQQFLLVLAQAVESHSQWFQLVFTLRSDFEPQFHGAAVESLWQCDRFLIRPMNREELRAAIEAPASAKVMYFDPPELVDRLIDEVNEMPGALPLLSFTLRELFLRYLRTADTRTNRAITAADYEALGGIKQSLVNRADEEYQALVKQDPAFADTMRRVMLRMVATGGTGNARRQVLLSELAYPEPEGDRVNQVIARFKEARLLVSDTNADHQPYVEPAHDALVEGWPRLLQWLESGTKEETLDQKPGSDWLSFLPGLNLREKAAALDEREKLLLQRRLTPAANDWHREQKKPKFLWHADARLPLLKQIRKRESAWFNATETEFVKCSLGRKRFVTVSAFQTVIRF